MKSFSQTLIEELNRKLELIHLETDDPLQYSEQAVKAIVVILEKLKTFFIRHKFDGKSEEIDFFKAIKPRFACKLVYYNDIYNIETNRPFGTAKEIRKYYSTELTRLKSYFNDNIEFYRYYKKGNTFLDNKYFVRGRHDLKLTLDSFYFQADHRFSTSHDYKVAKILASELLQQYLEAKINEFSVTPQTALYNTVAIPPLKWTGPKAGIVELIYALHAEGVFNHANCELKEVVRYFEKAFDIDLPQFHRTFFEISSRKAERTKFLNALSEKLIRRMDDLDKIK